MTLSQGRPRPAMNITKTLTARALLLVLLAVSLHACGRAFPGTPAGASQPAAPSEAPAVTPAAGLLPVDTPAVGPTLTPTAPPPSVWLPDDLPARLRDSIRIPEGWAAAPEPATDGLQVRVASIASSQEAQPIASWVYALAAPFATTADEVSAEDLRRVWTTGATDGLPFERLLVESTVQSVLAEGLGKSSEAVLVVHPDRLLETAWNTPNTWAIVPFEYLEPRWKVIMIDGQSPVQKDFDQNRYPLVAHFVLQGAPDLRERFMEGQSILPSNRDPDKLTTVMLTGVTALVRGTASLMEVIGLTYPAQDIGPWLREADILHISNEVPFARNCPQPFEWKDLVFCSQAEYITLLEDVGADVIELTGDHFADWGPDAMLYTLELYRERGWPYYGGGANLAEAQQPALLEHNGNKIAFLGCNGKEPGYATAGASNPGAAHCDFDLLATKIKELRANGYLPIVTFQHLEYYQYIALPELEVDFHRVSAAGAAIVSGSQAHMPHAFQFREGAFLHYGLGNLFFDQTNQGDPPRTAFIDRHVIYDGRHISTELLTIYLVDYARSRPMTEAERKTLLRTVFEASGWPTAGD